MRVEVPRLWTVLTHKVFIGLTWFFNPLGIRTATFLLVNILSGLNKAMYVKVLLLSCIMNSKLQHKIITLNGEFIDTNYYLGNSHVYFFFQMITTFEEKTKVIFAYTKLDILEGTLK